MNLKLKLTVLLLTTVFLSSCTIVDQTTAWTTGVYDKLAQTITDGKQKITDIKTGITDAQERLQAKINQVNELVQQVQDTKASLQKLVGDGGGATDQAKIKILEDKLKALEAAQSAAKTEADAEA